MAQPSVPQNYARKIGKIIRQQRHAAGLTGTALAERAGMSQSKLSKLENGVGIFATTDIERLLAALAAPKNIQQQIIMLLEKHQPTTETMQVEVRINPRLILSRETEAARICIFTMDGIPVLLQTVPYRQAILRRVGASEELEAVALSAMQSRQDLIWTGKRQYQLLMTEMALYTLFGTIDVQLGQLDRLERFVAADIITCGIIPTKAGVVTINASNFVLYDEREAILELFTGQLSIRSKATIEKYETAFTTLQQSACYKADAVRLIRKAVAYFNPDASV